MRLYRATGFSFAWFAPFLRLLSGLWYRALQSAISERARDGTSMKRHPEVMKKLWESKKFIILSVLLIVLIDGFDI
jgi:hypothetical protein